MRIRNSIAALLLAVFLPVSGHGKDLYLTVRRDFAPTETPVVEVNYRSADPLTFRLLKPKDLKSFIASQIDLRRSWKEPKVEVNTANPFLSGLNKLTLSFDWLRKAANVDMRKGLIGQFGGASYRERGSNFKTGPRNFIAAPDDFTIVKEFSFEPKSADDKKPFDVPGFEEWNGSSLSTRMVDLPRLEPGFYVLQTIQNQLEGQVVVVVNDIQASLQQTDGTVLIRATDRAGRPAKDAKVSLRDLNAKWIGEKTIDDDGVTEFQGVVASELVAVIEGKGTAIVDTEFFSTTAVSEDLYLYSDRPMYKPSDEVHFRGILREPKDGVSRLLGAKSVRVSLVSTEGLIIASEQNLKTTDFGTFSGSFTPQKGDTGLYRVVANVDEKSHVGEFRIKDYVKPVFFARLSSKQETLRPGERIAAKLKVERYAGGAPRGAKYRAELYRTRLEAPKWIDDAGMSETGSKVTYGRDAEVASDISIPELIKAEDEANVGANGEATINMLVPADIKGDSRYDYKFILKITVVDADGNTATTSKNFIDMKAEILAQSQITASFAAPDTPATLKARAVYPSGKTYGKTKGSIEWYQRAYKSEETLLSKTDFDTDESGRYEVKVPAQQPGQIRAVVSLFDRNNVKAEAESTIVILPPKLGEGVIDVPEMTLMTGKYVYAPGDTAKALVLLPEGWGEDKSNDGRIYITVAGSKIFEKRTLKVNGLSTFIEQKITGDYGTSVYVILSYSDPVKGWVERTLPFVIPPAEKILNLTVKPATEITLPGSEQSVKITVLDNKGKPVKSELSVAVVDRAVLDLQGEFRPSLLEFFYPPARLNLMSFFSTQFQSYGYGDTIAKLFKANHWFAATKNAREDRLVEKDTAFWTGAVVTDSNGEASVKFRLPANQTIWQVTAVAADKGGRFGESTAEFKANSPVQTILAMPSFLRVGDKGQVRLTLMNQDRQRAHKLKYALSLPTGATLDQPIFVERELTPGEEVRDSRQLQIDAIAEGGVLKFNEDVEFKDQKLAFVQDIRTLSDRTPVTEIFSLTKAGDIVKVNEDETISSALITVTSGLSGAIAPALRWLVRYPHGCVEQITNQTIPNLLVSNIFDESNRNYQAKLAQGNEIQKALTWSGHALGQAVEWVVAIFRGPTIESKMTARNRTMLDEAKSFGEAGLSQIASYQNSDGSYAWFQEENSGSVPMTMFVLLSILSTDNPDWAKRVNATKAFNFLTYQGFESGTAQKMMLAYLSGRLRALKIVDNTPESYEPNLRQQLETAIASGVPLQQAYMLLAVKDHGLKLEGDWNKLTNEVTTSLTHSLSKFLADGADQASPWRNVSMQWNEYIGQDASSVAVVSHALQAFGKLDPKLRADVIRFLMTKFKGDNFGSTFETGQVLAHTAWILKEELRKRDSGESINVKINGGKISSVNYDVVSDISGWNIALKPALFKNGENRIEIDDADEFMSASVRLTREVPMTRAASANRGWDLEKSYFRVDEKTLRMTALADGKVKVGEILYVKMKISRTQDSKFWQSTYYTLKDDVPAGMSVIEEDKELIGKFALNNTSAKVHSVRKVRADSVQWYYKFDRGWMERGNEVGYFLRADFAGDYVTGVARIEDFYDEQAFAQTKASRIGIDPL